MENNKPWFVYILLCTDNSYYTGIALNVEQRFASHKAGKGARYTKIRGVEKIIFVQKCSSHSEALKREIQVKRLSRAKKELLIASNSPNISN